MAACVAGVVPAAAAPLGTGFTSRGKLNGNDQPANATCDFIFVLYHSPTNQVPVYRAVLNDNVTVTSGLFTSRVNLVADLFTGQELWLGVAVRPGDETGAATLLASSHPLSAKPYAHFARQAAVEATGTTCGGRFSNLSPNGDAHYGISNRSGSPTSTSTIATTVQQP